MTASLKFHQILAPVAVALALACGGGGGSKTSTAAGGTVTVLPPQFDGDAYWVAYQDGSGPWKVVGPSNGKYTFTVTDPAGRYGMALIDEEPGSPTPAYVDGQVHYFTLAEVSQIDYSSFRLLTSAVVTGSVSGLQAADTARVHVRTRAANVAAGGSSYNFLAFSGTHNLAAIRQAGGGAADRLVVLRNISLPSSVPPIDFASQGFALTPQSATATGEDSGDSVVTYANWLTPNTSTNLAIATGNALAFNALPAANHQADETHFIGARATQSATGKTCLAGRYTKSPVGVAITLPAKINSPVFGTAVTTPYYRPTLSWSPIAGSLASDVFAADTTNHIYWSATFSAGWLAGNTATSYTFPDFSGLAGWNNAWGFAYGSSLSWSFANRWTSSPDAPFFVNIARSHPEGERFWRSYMNLSTTATLAPQTISPAGSERKDGHPGRRPRRGDDSESH